MKYLLWLTIGAALWGQPLHAQVAVVHRCADTSRVVLTEELGDTTTRHLSPSAMRDALVIAVRGLHEAGYWGAGIDSLTTVDSLHWIAHWYVGGVVRWWQLRTELPPDVLRGIRYQPWRYEGRALSLGEVETLRQQVLAYAESHGYPFAQVWLDSVQVDARGARAILRWDRQRFMTFEGVRSSGTAKISRAYLERYLDIQAGMPYDEARIRAIDRKLRALPFLKLERSPVVEFEGDMARVNLQLAPQQSSKLDFLLGVLPSNPITGRALITGNFDMRLQNPFGMGKTITVNWQRLRAQTSRLRASLDFPYLAGLPLGLEGSLDLYRRDSTLQDTELNAGVQYLISAQHSLKVYSRSVSRNTLAVDEGRIIALRALPAQLDVRVTTSGLAYRQQVTDAAIAPTRGWQIALALEAGRKAVRRSSLVTGLRDPADPTFDFGTLYDSLPPAALQWSGTLDAAVFQPLGKRWVMMYRLQGGALASATALYQNEVYRIGGNQLLRGFDEESLLATLYAVATIEPRFLLNETSYLFAFGDVAYRQNRTLGNDLTDWPIGLGAGLSLQTPAGLVRLSYALGRQLANPFDFRAAKIHFGYVNYF